MVFTRLIFFAALTAFAMAFTAGIAGHEAHAARPKAASISSEERAELQRIERYLNQIRTMRARFLQVSSNGQAAEGDLYLSRPGHLRVEYDPPVPVLIVADGRFLIYYDSELEQVSYIPLGSTPASILTRADIDLQGSELILTDFTRNDGIVRVTLVQADDPYSGSVTLVFQRDPMTLRRWTVVDAQGVETDVSLVAARFGEPIDPDLFEFKDPRIFGKDF